MTFTDAGPGRRYIAYRAWMIAQTMRVAPTIMRKTGPDARFTVMEPMTLVFATSPNTPDATSERPSKARRREARPDDTKHPRGRRRAVVADRRNDLNAHEGTAPHTQHRQYHATP